MLRDLLHRFMVGHWPTHGVWMLGNESAQMPLVTPTTALRHTPVYRACSLIANDVARTELNIDDEIVATFLRQPNRWQTGFEFRRAMTISNGDWTVFVTQPLSAALLAVSVLALAGPRLWRMLRG